MGFGSKRLKAKKANEPASALRILWRTASTRAYSVNPEPKLAQARHNATTPGMRRVSLAQLSRTYATAMLMRDIGAVQLMLAYNLGRAQHN
jgi:hypothetical protein